MSRPQLERTDDVRYTIPATEAMRVPGVIYASDQLLPDDDGGTLQQVANVATLPGIVGASYAMPDLHLGYGFPIGGVAATDVENGGVISPGGVGFDISCGVRVLVAPLTLDEVEQGSFARLMDVLGDTIPRGTGPGGIWEVTAGPELQQLLTDGAAYAVARGFGTEDDLAHTEDGGRLADADAADVSDKARQRGLRQLGSLGSGNHFLEVQVVDEIVDRDAADGFGLQDRQLCVMIHCGSRGLGHQICTDHVRSMRGAIRRFGIELPDEQLACAPVESAEGQAYLRAMAAAANYGRANRQVLAEATRDAFGKALGTRDLTLLYDVSHNMAKLERHAVEDSGRAGSGTASERLLCVHRKGSTLALPPGHPDLPADLAPAGQPVPVPGSMGTASWILAGRGQQAWASTCHGAGRAQSRGKAKKTARGEDVRAALARNGIAVRALSDPGLAEEAPAAYKDVDEVVRVCERAGLSQRVARLLPAGVVKG